MHGPDCQTQTPDSPGDLPPSYRALAHLAAAFYPVRNLVPLSQSLSQ